MTKNIVTDSARLLWVNLLICGLYWGCAWLVSLFFSAYGLFPAPIWPSAGIALAAMMLGGLNPWPGIFAGSLLANYFLFDPPLWAAAAISVGNTAGPWLGALLIARTCRAVTDHGISHPGLAHLPSGKRLQGAGDARHRPAMCTGVHEQADNTADSVPCDRLRRADRPFASVPDTARFVVLGIAMHSLIVGGNGALVIKLLHDLPAAAAWSIFIRWMLADAVGALVITPVILLWWRHRDEVKTHDPETDITAPLLILLTVMFTLVLFFGIGREAPADFSGLPYLLVAPLIWAAVQFPLRDAFTMFSLMAVIATIGTVMGLGPFNHVHAGNPLIALGLLVVTLGLTILAIGSVSFERRRYAHRLADSNLELERRVEERTAELNRAMQEAAAANHAKSEFVAVMSHELRTPMTGVLGAAQLLRETRMDPEGVRLLDMLRHTGEHLLAVIDDVLDLSRIEEGRIELRRDPFTPARLVGEALEMVLPAARERGIDLVSELGPLPDRMVGDPVRLRQVLTNLIANAVKYTDGSKVTVRAEGLEPDKGRVPIHFAVEDTGSRIAPEERERIFRPFEQLGGAPARRQGGAGLGLAICRKLVEAMGGTIHLESGPVQGNCFWFVVDLEQATGERTANTGRVAPGPLAILLVEDMAINRDIIGRLLERDGHRVTAVEDGQAAVKEAARGRFDLVLMDVQMPRMDGLEATRRIRALAAPERAGVPVLALTADVTPETAGRCRDAGMDGLVVKPLRLREFYEAVAASNFPRDLGAARSLGETALEDKRLTEDYRARFTPKELAELNGRHRRTLEEEEERLRAAWAVCDLDGMARAAHKIAGSAATAGFSALARAARQLEDGAVREEEERISELLKAYEDTSAATAVLRPGNG